MREHHRGDIATSAHAQNHHSAKYSDNAQRPDARVGHFGRFLQTPEQRSEFGIWRVTPTIVVLKNDFEGCHSKSFSPPTSPGPLQIKDGGGYRLYIQADGQHQPYTSRAQAQIASQACLRVVKDGFEELLISHLGLT